MTTVISCVLAQCKVYDGCFDPEIRRTYSLSTKTHFPHVPPTPEMSSAALAARRVLAAASHSSHEGGGQYVFTPSFNPTQARRGPQIHRFCLHESRWTLTAELAAVPHSCDLALHQKLYFMIEMDAAERQPRWTPLQSWTFTGCFPQRGPGRSWPSCWPSLGLASAWPTPTWRCRHTRTSSQNSCHILTCVSAPRWASNCAILTPVQHE